MQTMGVHEVTLQNPQLKAILTMVRSACADNAFLQKTTFCLNSVFASIQASGPPLSEVRVQILRKEVI